VVHARDLREGVVDTTSSVEPEGVRSFDRRAIGSSGPFIATTQVRYRKRREMGADVTDDIHIGVVGAGATGAYLAAALTSADYDVTILTRGRSTSAIRERGITIVGADDGSIVAKPARVVESGDRIEPVDVTLFCVKAYDTAEAANDAAGLVGDDGAILCLQNGVANEERLAEVYGEHRVMSGVLYIGAERLDPGVVRVLTPARVMFGPYTEATAATKLIGPRLQMALEAAGVDTTLDGSIRSAKWQKFLFNCGLNPLTAITGKRLGEIRSHPAGRAIFSALIEEATRAAQAAGAPIAGDALEQAEATGDQMDISSSMAEDLKAGRALELDAFTGHVLDLAEEAGMAAPTTRIVHALLEIVDPRSSTGTASNPAG
jgi:2-dehydropantoate 2-reductase